MVRFDSIYTGLFKPLQIELHEYIKQNNTSLFSTTFEEEGASKAALSAWKRMSNTITFLNVFWTIQIYEPLFWKYMWFRIRQELLHFCKAHSNWLVANTKDHWQDFPLPWTYCENNMLSLLWMGCGFVNLKWWWKK